MVLNIKNIIHIVSFLIISISLVISVIVFFYTNYEGYELLFVQPLTYAIAYSLVLRKTLNRNKIRIFFIVLIIVSFLRYVCLPLLIVISNYYGGKSYFEPKSDSMFIAILLMNYELIVYSLFIAYKESKLKRKVTQKKSSYATSFVWLKGNNIGYILFGILSVIGVVLYPSALNMMNFIFPTSLDMEYETSTIENLVIYSVIVSKQLLFIIITKKLYFRYIKSRNSKYILINFLIAFLNIFIYFGGNRSDILISAIVSFLVLFVLYGKATRKYLIAATVMIIFMLNIVTEARKYRSVSDDAIVDLAATVQTYSGGVYNVAIAIETNENIPENAYLSMLFFDIFRSMIGVNIFIKDLPFKYSNQFFNERIFIDIGVESQILPMIGQGHLYFGFFLAPIFGLLFLNLFYFLEQKSFDTKNLEIYYFLSLVIARFGFFMGQNTSNLINDMSMNLVLFLMVYYFNKYTTQIILRK